MNKKIIINDVFENIDSRLIQEGVPITLRYIKATGEVSKYFDNIPVPLSSKNLLPNNDFGNQLTIWLSSWYDAKYGNNQQYDSDLGFFYQEIRGDLWRFRVPDFYGRCMFFIDTNLEICGANNETNILRMCPQLTQAYVNSLNENEMQQLASNFNLAVETLQILNTWKIKKVPLYKDFDADLKTISAQLGNHSSNYGQARWGYLQCAEKILKSWLLDAGYREEKLRKDFGHNIRKLLSEFNKCYIERVSITQIDDIACSAGARYGEGDFSKKDIIKAQEWLFNLVKSIGDAPRLAMR
ncbi:hypothetical protein IDSA_11320 [Pseudidiomarina salinarum]|uniref:HEPN domain-containing protein n=1 Tax=Pseudidiomarina salinarum TaxID=435908 RepID=A0A094ISR6_9GAMM|nr:hypothetical protein [Pseudidiomarina salinarum]KFZ30197.1 hypothetical protein IDSA_11320 [Pseudidiomarina salinarum]RUO68646.1 hypothetical protein CWI79_11290 [Pseudidiomarina salinarum]